MPLVRSTDLFVDLSMVELAEAVPLLVVDQILGLWLDRILRMLRLAVGIGCVLGLAVRFVRLLRHGGLDRVVLDRCRIKLADLGENGVGVDGMAVEIDWRHFIQRRQHAELQQHDTCAVRKRDDQVDVRQPDRNVAEVEIETEMLALLAGDDQRNVCVGLVDHTVCRRCSRGDGSRRRSIIRLNSGLLRISHAVVGPCSRRIADPWRPFTSKANIAVSGYQRKNSAEGAAAKLQPATPLKRKLTVPINTAFTLAEAVHVALWRAERRSDDVRRDRPWHQRPPVWLR